MENQMASVVTEIISLCELIFPQSVKKCNTLKVNSPKFL